MHNVGLKISRLRDIRVKLIFEHSVGNFPLSARKMQVHAPHQHTTPLVLLFTFFQNSIIYTTWASLRWSVTLGGLA